MQFNVEYILYKKLLIVLAISISSIVHSQSISIEHYGLKVGTTASSPIWSHDSKSDSHVQTKWGLDIGAFIEFNLAENLSLVPEIHFTQKGLRYDIPITTIQFPDGTGQYITLKPNANYLSIPVNIKYSIYKTIIDIYLSGGVRLDLLVNKNGDGFDIFYNNFKKIDFGLNMILGVRTNELFGFGAGVEFRYSPNLTSSYSDDTQKITNSSFDFLFLIFF